MGSVEGWPIRSLVFGIVRLATTRWLVFGQRSGCHWLLLYPCVVCSYLRMG